MALESTRFDLVRIRARLAAVQVLLEYELSVDAADELAKVDHLVRSLVFDVDDELGDDLEPAPLALVQSPPAAAPGRTAADTASAPPAGTTHEIHENSEKPGSTIAQEPRNAGPEGDDRGPSAAESAASAATCAAPGCYELVAPYKGRGPRPRFCSSECRVRDNNQRHHPAAAPAPARSSSPGREFPHDSALTRSQVMKARGYE
jgi:hypothetical protein